MSKEQVSIQLDHIFVKKKGKTVYTFIDESGKIYTKQLLCQVRWDDVF